MAGTVGLKRVISMPMLVFYGLGNILGAGIYVLIGEIAGVAGYHAPFAFVVASLLVAPTALSYAELSARFPVSAGESVYVDAAFGATWLSTMVGLMIAAAGVVSIAALSRGFAGYLSVLVDLPETLVLTVLVGGLGALCAWGIGASVRVAALLTLIEIGGLLLVVWAAGDSLAALPVRIFELLPDASASAWRGIVAGAFLAFFAFLGFEDMVNVAEEVRDPVRDLPRAILVALAAAALLYAAVTLVAVLAVPPERLGGSAAPLSLVFEAATGRDAVVVTLIGLFAAVNGALVQFVMVSRILYGMSRRGWLPAPLSRVGRRTGTPLVSTALTTMIVLVLSFGLPLVTLARTTSFIILAVFILVNVALWRIKTRLPEVPDVPRLPEWVPILGAAAGAGFLLASVLTA
ncbi:MAG: amino acid permease [Proteobacteria bacterium]|nr:MAG: amino acid permease [Pseudomonadota bacterium]